MRATVTGELARSLGPTERAKTPGFLAVECRLATLDPHMRCNDLLNLACRRSAANGDLVSGYTEYEDVVREGLATEAALSSHVREVLEGAGVKLADDGSVSDHSALDALTTGAGSGMLRYDPSADPSELCGAEAEIAGFVARYNRGKDEAKRIAGPFELEADPSRVVYVSVDDVLTHRQTRTREAAARDGTGATGEWIFHSVAHVEFNGEVAVFEARSQGECYAAVLACLVENGLADRRVVVITDGEERLKEAAEGLLSGWPHDSYLDYYHVRENLSGRFSQIFRPGKVVDPTVEPERFKNGRIKKSSIARITRSQYHLREVVAMVWAGNVDGAIGYLRAVDPSELKPGGDKELESAVAYLERKRDRIPCYALRAHRGLRNSSNAVERANNALVSRRQKKKGTSWCDDGSFALSGLTAVFESGRSERYFTTGELTLALRPTSGGSKGSGVSWLRDAHVELTVTSSDGYRAMAAEAA